MNISRADWVLFVLTLLMGMVAGAYLYAMSFKPIYQPEGSVTGGEAGALEFSVIAKAYGGFHPREYVHPSFRITGDGNVSYYKGGENAIDQTAVEVSLPRSLFNRLVDDISRADLEELSYPDPKDTCRIASDGVDYTYRITMDRTQYEMDTCYTALPYDHSLTQTLEDVWSYLRDPSQYQGSRSGGASGSGWTVSGYVAELLEQYFGEREESSGDTESETPTACTMEAKICPDGSAVGRTGPNCSFAPCPGE